MNAQAIKVNLLRPRLRLVSPLPYSDAPKLEPGGAECRGDDVAKSSREPKTDKDPPVPIDAQPFVHFLDKATRQIGKARQAAIDGTPRSQILRHVNEAMEALFYLSTALADDPDERQGIRNAEDQHWLAFRGLVIEGSRSRIQEADTFGRFGYARAAKDRDVVILVGVDDQCRIAAGEDTEIGEATRRAMGSASFWMDVPVAAKDAFATLIQAYRLGRAKRGAVTLAAARTALFTALGKPMDADTFKRSRNRKKARKRA